MMDPNPPNPKAGRGVQHESFPNNLAHWAHDIKMRVWIGRLVNRITGSVSAKVLSPGGEDLGEGGR